MRLGQQSGGVLMLCPKCKSRAIGKIGQNQYYCWDCGIEFTLTNSGVRMYRLEPDGTAMPESFDGAAQPILTGVRESQMNAGLQVADKPGQQEEDIAISSIIPGA